MKKDALADIEVPREVLAGAAVVQDALDRRAALVKRAADLKAALPGLREAAAVAASAFDDAETDLGAAADDEVAALTRVCAKAAAAKTAADDAVAQAERGERGAKKRAGETDGEIAAAHAVLTATLRPWRAEIVDIYRRELVDAAAALASVMRRGYAIASALPTGRLRDALDSTVVADPTARQGEPMQLIDRAGRLRGALAGGAGFTDMALDFPVDPVASALHALLAPLGAIERAGQQQQKRIAIDRMAAEAAQPSGERRQKAPAPQWPPPSWEEIRAERAQDRERLIAEGKIAPNGFMPAAYTTGGAVGTPAANRFGSG